MKRADVKVGMMCFTKVGKGWSRVEVEVLREVPWTGSKGPDEYVVKRVSGEGRELQRSPAALHTTAR